jgi:hypothetical protein
MITVNLTSAYTLTANTVYYLALLIGNSTVTAPTVVVSGANLADLLNIGTSQSAGTFVGGGRSLGGAAGQNSLPSPIAAGVTPSRLAYLPWLGVK